MGGVYLFLFYIWPVGRAPGLGTEQRGFRFALIWLTREWPVPPNVTAALNLHVTSKATSCQHVHSGVVSASTDKTARFKADDGGGASIYSSQKLI